MKLCSKYIDLLFICPPDVKRPKSFRRFTQWTPTKTPLWISCGAYKTLRTSSALYNIQNPILVQKKDISKTAWINSWISICNVYKFTFATTSCITWYIQEFWKGFGMLVFFTNISLMESQIRYLALFCLFSE